MSDWSTNSGSRALSSPDTTGLIGTGLFKIPNRFSRISFPLFLGTLLVAGVFAAVTLNLNAASHPRPSLGGSRNSSIFEGDTWWHIVVGDRILSTHRWPVADSDSFTAHGQPWIATEWAGEFVLAATNRLGGVFALTVSLISLASLILLLMFYYSYLKSRNEKAAFVACAMVLPLAAVSFSLRPQLFGYIFLLIELILLERFRQGKCRSLWLLPVIFLVWVNTHGTFFLGFALLTFYIFCGLTKHKNASLVADPWTRRQRLHLEIVYLLSLIAVVFTPYGSRLAFSPVAVGLFQPVNLGNIQEWQALNFGEPYGGLFLLCLIFFVAAQLARRLIWRIDEVGFLLIAIYSAGVHLRLLIFFAIIFAPMLAKLLDPWLPASDPAQVKPALNAALIGIIFCCLIGFFPDTLEIERVVKGAFPQGAVSYLTEHPPTGRLFNDDFWGGFLEKEMGSKQKVFIDGRADLYESAGVLQDYLQIVHVSSDTDAILATYGINACLIARGSALETYLRSVRGWRVANESGPSVLLVREPRTATALQAITPQAQVLNLNDWSSHSHEGQ